MAGDTDAQVFDFVVARFGEGVLFNPPARGANLVLWFAGPALLLAGIGVAVAAGRRRVAPEASLSPQEEAQVREILRE